SGQFSPEHLVSTSAYGARYVFAADMDGDGDTDVLGAFSNKIAWYENLGGGFFLGRHVITEDSAPSIYAADLDGDGDMDVLSAGGNKIAWYENLGGGTFSQQKVITTQANGAAYVYATDLDGDGDMDVLSASERDDKIAWYENLGGGVFSRQRIVAPNADGAQSVYAADLDGDGDLDILWASDTRIAWNQNLTIGPEHEQSPIKGRYLFYNESYFDGDDPAGNSHDDGAIAFEKRALLPGQTASFANYTSYTRGINGIMVDIGDLPRSGTVTADDFSFKVGNSQDVAAWAVAPAPQEVAVRPGEGCGGSDRVTITWADGAIRNEWLQVTVKATANTGLTQDDVFYFGNALGEAGDRPGNTYVNATDELLARVNKTTRTERAEIDNPYDYNRDSHVNALDELWARVFKTSRTTALVLLNAPAEELPAAAEMPAEIPAAEETFQAATAAPLAKATDTRTADGGADELAPAAHLSAPAAGNAAGLVPSAATAPVSSPVAAGTSTGAGDSPAAEAAPLADAGAPLDGPPFDVLSAAVLPAPLG
ncbi:MAG: VCBS repeat-containing protein, partial [Planctomycetes bacterium]|nr:VCBS repeat-containing protein [Planctomycetota bacterium]